MNGDSIGWRHELISRGEWSLYPWDLGESPKARSGVLLAAYQRTCYRQVGAAAARDSAGTSASPRRGVERGVRREELLVAGVDGLERLHGRRLREEAGWCA